MKKCKEYFKIYFPKQVPWEEIINLNKEIFRKLFQRPYSMGDYLEKLLKNSPPIVGLLREERRHQLIGNIISFCKNQDMYIWLLGVRKDKRNQGIGSALLDCCEIEEENRKLLSLSAKVYDVSPEMKRILSKKGYRLIETTKNEIDPKYNINYFLKKIKQ